MRTPQFSALGGDSSFGTLLLLLRLAARMSLEIPAWKEGIETVKAQKFLLYPSIYPSIFHPWRMIWVPVALPPSLQQFPAPRGCSEGLTGNRWTLNCTDAGMAGVWLCRQPAALAGALSNRAGNAEQHQAPCIPFTPSQGMAGDVLWESE